MRTWAPCGQTPILEFNFNWQRVSVIAGLTTRNFCFRLHPGAIRTPQVIAFLRQLRRFLRGRRLLLLWDRATIHRSKKVRAYLDRLHGQIEVAYLPAYAPRTQSHRIPLGLLETHRTGQFLPKRHLGTRTLCHPSPQTHPPPSTKGPPHCRFL